MSVKSCSAVHGQKLREYMPEFRRQVEKLTTKGVSEQAAWEKVLAKQESRLARERNRIEKTVREAYEKEFPPVVEETAGGEAAPADEPSPAVEAAAPAELPAPAAEPTQDEDGPSFSTVMSGQAAPGPQGFGNATTTDVTPYLKHAPGKALLQGLFERMGWNRIPTAVAASADKVKEYLRTEWPSAAAVMSYINSRFNVSPLIGQWIADFKTERLRAVGVANDFTHHLRNADNMKALEAFAYLDDAKQTGNVPGYVRASADRLRSELETLVKAVPNKELRDYLQGLKPSEMLTWVTTTEDLATHAFGAHKLENIFGKLRLKVNGDNIIAPKLPDGTLNLDGKFYAAIANNAEVIDTFVHESMVNSPEVANFRIQHDKSWKFLKSARARDGSKLTEFEFARNRTAADALRQSNDPAAREEAVNALLNTVSILANAVSTSHLTRAMASLAGSKEHGAVFEDADSLKDHLGYMPTVLELSNKSAESPVVAAAYRRPTEWVKVPNSPAYGALAGMYVNGSAWMAVQDSINRKPVSDNAAFVQARRVMRIFKKSKTVYNIPTHVTNAMTNFTLMHMHNISFSTVKQAGLLYFRYKIRPDSLKPEELAVIDDFIRSGAVLADYSTTEVKQALYDKLVSQLNSSKKGPHDMLLDLIQWEKIKGTLKLDKAIAAGQKVDDVATDIYAAEDNIFRLAAFMTEMGNLAAKEKQGAPKTSKAEKVTAAGRFAKEAFLDYDIDSRAVQALRQTVLPFVSWTYAVIPVLTKIAARQPWKIATLMGAYQILSAVMSSLDGDDGEEDHLKRVRDRKQETVYGMYRWIRMPFLDQPGQRAYVDIGRWIPNPISFKDQPNGFMGLKWWPGALTPNGPMVSLAAAGLGVDPYTGSKLFKNTDSNFERFVKSSGYLAKQMTPGVALGAYKAVDPNPGPLGRFDAHWERAAKFIGFPTIDVVDEAEARVSQRQKLKGIARDFAIDISSIKRDARTGKITQEEARKRIEELKARRTERLNEAKGID